MIALLQQLCKVLTLVAFYIIYVVDGFSYRLNLCPFLLILYQVQYVGAGEEHH